MYDLISGDDLLLSGDELDAILSGDDDDYVGAYDLVGASRRGGRGAALRQRAGNKRNALAQAVANKRAEQGVILRTTNPSKNRRQVLGMVSNGTVAAGASATITARPQTFAFKPQRVIIPATVGPDFTIQDIKVGNQSQLVQTGDLPAEAFSQTSFGVEMDMDTIQTSQDFIFSVTNISGGARTFRAMIVGLSANG